MTKADQGGPGSKLSTTSPQEDEGFLGRWSRRKAEARTEIDSTAVDLQDDQEADLTESETEQVNQPPAAVDPATLPDIDKMEAGSDFSVFMQAGVPQELKTKALRKLWRVKPDLANLDGLIDYGEDLTGSFKVVDHLKTAYEVGKGFLKDEGEQPPNDASSEAGDDESADKTVAEEEAKPEEIDLKTEHDETQVLTGRHDPIAEKDAKG